jgi:hypothetical protein
MTPPVQPVPAADQSQQVTDLLNRIFNSSNWRGEVEKTVKKNTRLQQLVRDQKAQLDKFAAKFNLETGEPKEGKLLTKEEPQSIRRLSTSRSPPKISRRSLPSTASSRRRTTSVPPEEQFADAAEALGFENVPALTRWLTREKLVLEFKDQRVEDEDTGKKVLMRMPYVRPAEDEKAVLEPLEEYIEREVPEFLDIFKTKPESDDDEEEGGREEGGDLDTDEMVRRASADAERRVSGKGGKSGVRVPATRSARSDNAGTKDSKKLADLEKDSRSSSLYSSI